MSTPPLLFANNLRPPLQISAAPHIIDRSFFLRSQAFRRELMNHNRIIKSHVPSLLINFQSDIDYFLLC